MEDAFQWGRQADTLHALGQGCANIPTGPDSTSLGLEATLSLRPLLTLVLE